MSLAGGFVEYCSQLAQSYMGFWGDELQNRTCGKDMQ